MSLLKHMPDAPADLLESYPRFSFAQSSCQGLHAGLPGPTTSLTQPTLSPALITHCSSADPQGLQTSSCAFFLPGRHS